uniref:Interleukin-17 receptor A-like n=1 Tax=Seriola dumerili TaxID=41447 RepID=A0A3B4VLS8_SERDU
MIHVLFFCFCLSAGLTVASSFWILNKRLDCSQPGLDHCKINNCSDKSVVAQRAPTSPDWGPEHVGVEMDKHGTVPVMNVQWKLKSDAGVLNLRGSEINILDESTNQSMCVQFFYNIQQQLNPNYTRWTFSLDGVVVEPGQTYLVSVVNLPEPKSGDNRIRKQITFPRCDDSRIQTARTCLENGSLWKPHMTAAMSVDRQHKKLYIVVSFEAAQYSERYQVSIQSQALHHSRNVSKENTTSLNVTFEFGLWQLSQCEMLLTIQPYFPRCKNHCRRHKEKLDYCPYYPPRTLIIKAVVGLLVIDVCLFYFLWRAFHKDSVNTPSSAAKDQPEDFQLQKTRDFQGLDHRKINSVNTPSSAAKSEPEGFQLQERKRVLIIYSLDHPLYKNIVLKLCGFLATKCGTEVVLDLLDSARLGMLGSIQWLDWHREQIESSSDKILILCSPGVQAKWRAMCGHKQVFLREDARSPVGDMLTPALSLMVPHFIRSASFEKYIVAYFDDICSEKDVPSPLNITVRYKLMKQFEEIFFRIHDTEKHEPGRVNHIEGLSEDEYHQCLSGRALRDAIDAFRAYQLVHPQWFEDELLESSEVEVEETSADIYDNATSQTSSHILYLTPSKSSAM